LTGRHTPRNLQCLQETPGNDLVLSSIILIKQA
jgi:hypothetical protein